MAQRLRARSWCFTINNDHFDDLESILDIECDYLIFGFETGENGTPHIQGYIHFNQKKSFVVVRNLFFHQRAHLEAARGSPEQNIKYCSKDGDFYEFGDRPKPGKRTDLIKVKDLILKKTPMTKIADDYFTDYIRYHKGFERFRDIQSNEVSLVEHVDRDDIDFNIDNALYVSKEAQLWSYDNEETLVILNPNGFDTYQLMMLGKGKPYIIGNKKVCPKRVIIKAQRCG